MKKLIQKVFPFKLEKTEKDSSLTGYAGLPTLYELFHKIIMPRIIQEFVDVKEAGWKEWALIESIMGMSASGGEHLSDINMLLTDKAFCKLVNKEKDKGYYEDGSDETNGSNQGGLVPSAKALERFLKKFHRAQEKPEGVDSWVPEETKGLKGLAKVNQNLARRLIKNSNLKVVTIENDATVVFSTKQECLGTYKGGVGYMPVLGVVAELGIIVGDEFRDGNVSPKFEVERFFKECEKSVPSTVKEIRARLDGAYYVHNFIKYLNDPNKNFGRIKFTITGEKDQSVIDWIEALPEESWQPLTKHTAYGIVDSGKEWAELNWVSAEGTRKTMKKRALRMVVTRKREEQWELFKEDFNAKVEKKDRYEVIVTNMDWAGDRLIRWHYEKGGSIEHINDRIKNDLAGGVLPCAEFGANAAWWRLQCLTWNMIRALQLLALPEELKNCHLKKLRHRLFCLAGRVIETGRELILRINREHPSYSLYEKARYRIAALCMT